MNLWKIARWYAWATFLGIFGYIGIGLIVLGEYFFGTIFTIIAAIILIGGLGSFTSTTKQKGLHK